MVNIWPEGEFFALLEVLLFFELFGTERLFGLVQQDVPEQLVDAFIQKHRLNPKLKPPLSG